MKYEQFKLEIKNRLGAYLPVEWSGWKVRMYPKYKVNQKLDAVTVMPQDAEARKTGAYPVFYVQDLYDLYQAGNDIGKILRYVSKVMQETPSQEEIGKRAFDIERLKDCVVLQLIHYERNRELLKELPHRRFLDLAVIYRAVVFDSEGKWAGMVVTNEIMKGWKLTEKQLYQNAWEHTRVALPYVLKDMGRMFESGIAVENTRDKIYFLSNDSLQFGAAAMLYPDILELAAGKFGGGYGILPGSIHELYLVKGSADEAEFWRDVVKTANEELVAPQEWLSDSIYYYDDIKKTINILL